LFTAVFPTRFPEVFNAIGAPVALQYAIAMTKLVLFFLAALLAACSGEPERQTAPIASPVDFGGYWEMDYGRSDDAEHKLRLLLRAWRRAAERRAAADRRGSLNMSFDIDARSREFEAIVAAARLANRISGSEVLEIEQSATDIEVRREDDFALTCVFEAGEPEVTVGEPGAEVCGWDGHELVFRVRLPDGLDILHRMTVAEAGNRLRVATTVDSSTAPPFTLNRFYFKFNPLPEDYSCEYTLSRGNVCQRERP